MIRRNPRLAIALAAAAGYLALAPRVVNGDGLGYLKATLAGALYPGHVAYVPLLGLLARLCRATRPVDLLWPARLLSAAAAATAALALGATARRRLGQGAATAATVGLLASWGTLSAGSDVESYAPALAALTLALWYADGERPLAAGLATAAAALLHVENVLFGLPALLLLPRGRGRFLAAAALPVAAVYGALVATRGVGWLGGASHGLHYPLRWVTPAVAIYGAAKALVYAPYPYEASWARVGLGCAVGLAAAAALATGMRRPLGRAVTAAWLVPYALVGVGFFASDAERWTFLLPLFWLAAAARPRRALPVAAAIAVANLALWLPLARDGRMRERAVAAAAHVGDGDLVIGPGHGWDEYVGFYDRSGARPFPLVYWAGAVGAARLPATLAEAVAATRAGGHAVYLARFGDDGDPLGYKELLQFGLTRATVRALLPPGHAVPVGDGLDRWDP